LAGSRRRVRRRSPTEKGQSAGHLNLVGHTLIKSEQTLYSWQQWAKDHGLMIDLNRGSRFRDAFMSVATALEGRGSALKAIAYRNATSGGGPWFFPLE